MSRDDPATVHGALFSGRRAADEIAARDHDRFVIIGAGIAGLGAASALTARGPNVTVFEARDRIGGRINSISLGGAMIDLGASWIHSTTDNPPMPRVAETNTDLRATDWNVFRCFGADGTPLRERQLPGSCLESLETTLAFGSAPMPSGSITSAVKSTSLTATRRRCRR